MRTSRRPRASRVLAASMGLALVLVTTLVVSGAGAVGGADQINTVVGTGTSGFSGDGGKATNATVRFPQGLAVDSKGAIVIGDTGNNRVRRVSPSGVIKTIAGTGAFGFSGDGGLATAAALNNPQGVAVDKAGNVYVVDTFNRRIRRIASDGTIVTIAGTGNIGYNGDGIPATSATFNDPMDVAVDSAGQVYVADSFNNRIRKITPDGVITTVAGNGGSGYNGDGIPATSATLSLPSGIAVDAGGNLYIADQLNNRVRRVSAGGAITTVAGNGVAGFGGDGGSALAAQLNSPQDVAVDDVGNVYIADTFNHRVRRVTPSGQISTIAGTGEADFSGDGGRADQARLNRPWNLAVDDAGTLYIVDRSNQRIRTIAKPSPKCGGKPATIVGTNGNDILNGTAKADVIVAKGGNDVVRGKGGADVICLGSGADRAEGGAGGDTIYGQAGNDQINGGSGNDRLLGGAGKDQLYGQKGRDQLVGGRGTDSGNGGTGTDVCKTEKRTGCP